MGVCRAQWITDGQGDLWVGSPFNVTARALKETGDLLVSTGLRDIGCPPPCLQPIAPRP